VIEEFMLMMLGLVGEEKGKWSLVVCRTPYFRRTPKLTKIVIFG
jgi:hypothetical protein